MNELSLQRARRLRRDATDAERLLWSRLRDRQLGGYKFRRQHPVDRYIVDFACLKPKLVVELDGSQHIQQRDYDRRRTAHLRSVGFVVTRYWSHHVLLYLEAVLEHILEKLTGLEQ